MTHDVRVRETQNWAKVRNPVLVIVFSFITVGIYGIFWWYFINRELRDLGRARGTDELGDSPATSVLAVTLGALIIVPALVSVYRTAQRIQAAQRLAGHQEILNGWIGGALFALIGVTLIPFFNGFVQSELNKVWETDSIAESPGYEAKPGGLVQHTPVHAPADPATPQPSAIAASADQLGLTKLAELRDSGVLTEAEFEAQKAKILARL